MSKTHLNIRIAERNNGVGIRQGKVQGGDAEEYRVKMHKIVAFMREVAESDEGVFVPSLISDPIKAAYKSGDKEELRRLAMELDEAITLANS